MTRISSLLVMYGQIGCMHSPVAGLSTILYEGELPLALTAYSLKLSR